MTWTFSNIKILKSTLNRWIMIITRYPNKDKWLNRLSHPQKKSSPPTKKQRKWFTILMTPSFIINRAIIVWEKNKLTGQVQLIRWEQTTLTAKDSCPAQMSSSKIRSTIHRKRMTCMIAIQCFIQTSPSTIMTTICTTSTWATSTLTLFTNRGDITIWKCILETRETSLQKTSTRDRHQDT